MALSDFWELKDNQIYNGKSVLNVYHLKRVDGGADAIVVAQAFLDWVLTPDMTNVQPDGLTRTTVEVENLGTPTDFTSLDSSAHSGGVAGDDLPSFNAATIQFNRTRVDMRNGRKTLLAGTESEQVQGTWVAGFVTLLQTLADKILDPWELDASPGIDMVEFCILKRFCVVPDQDPCQVYRLPNTPAEVDANHYVPTTATVRSNVRSQVSRKQLN